MLFRQINLKDVSNLDYFKSKYAISDASLKSAEIACEISNIDEQKDIPVLLSLLNTAKLSAYLSQRASEGVSSVFVLASAIKLFYQTSEKGASPFIKILNNLIKDYLSYNDKVFNLCGVDYSVGGYLIMGILNVTPDSFSDGGKYCDVASAVNRGVELLEEGADILDVGGESTRPGAAAIPAAEEIKRVVPVIEQLREKRPDAVISIDTSKSPVAKAAINAGAKIINDISAFGFDETILDVAAENNAPYILMHMLGSPKTMQNEPEYSEAVSDIIDFLYRKAERAKKKGAENIIIDPGIGFGKSVEHNFEILRRLSEFKSLNYPILIGLSRKSFIGKSLNLDVENRDEPTTLLEALSVKNGASIIRTHNVKLANRTRNILRRL